MNGSKTAVVQDSLLIEGRGVVVVCACAKEMRGKLLAGARVRVVLADGQAWECTVQDLSTLPVCFGDLEREPAVALLLPEIARPEDVPVGSLLIPVEQDT